MAAAFSNGMITDTVNWRCTNQTEVDWNQDGFDASHWPEPVQVYTGHPVGCEAEAIWFKYHTVQEYMYCRYTGPLI